MKSPRYRREVAEVTAILVRHGISRNELPRRSGTTAQRFDQWAVDHRELKDALKTASTAECAEAALIKRALGFQLNEASAEELVDKKSGEPLEILKRRTITKDVPPDVRALLFYLKNRCPERWSENPSAEEFTYQVPEEESDL